MPKGKHRRSIRGNNKVAELYSFLLEHEGQWFDTWYLTTEFRIAGAATAISEIRTQLDEDPSSTHCIERKTSGPSLNWYRLVRRHQLELFEEAS